MYQIEQNQLRVCTEYLQKGNVKSLFENSRLILLQHLLPDTEQFIKLLTDTKSEIFCILGKPFSFDKAVKERLEKQFRVEVHPYDVYDNTHYLDELLEAAVSKSRLDKKQILILEVGGYFAKPLIRVSENFKEYIKGVVEVTTFGHNKYIRHAESIHVPVFSVARSPIKTIEARYVGRAANTATDMILRDIGVSMAGRRALVIGFGMIGKSVADSLRANNLIVSVDDRKGFARLNAFTRGYELGERLDLIKNADIIFSATAAQSMSYDDISKCKNNAILVSVGSRGNELDVQGLEDNCMSSLQISENIKKYKLNTNKNVFLIRNGTAVNFHIKSCPDEIVDLIHAEVLSCALLLLTKSKEITLHRVNETPEATLHGISKDWIKHLVN